MQWSSNIGVKSEGRRRRIQMKVMSGDRKSSVINRQTTVEKRVQTNRKGMNEGRFHWHMHEKNQALTERHHTTNPLLPFPFHPLLSSTSRVFPFLLSIHLRSTLFVPPSSSCSPALIMTLSTCPIFCRFLAKGNASVIHKFICQRSRILLSLPNLSSLQSIPA